MDTREIWTERVAEWKESGLTSRVYCEGKPFTAGGLRHWAYRLRQEAQRKTEQPKVRIARVVRKTVAGTTLAEPRGDALERTAAPETLAIECGRLRVAVRPGFDRETLAAVLDVLAVRGGGR